MKITLEKTKDLDLKEFYYYLFNDMKENNIQVHINNIGKDYLENVLFRYLDYITFYSSECHCDMYDNVEFYDLDNIYKDRKKYYKEYCKIS